jgi:uncharacterized protein (DUF4415 family)
MKKNRIVKFRLDPENPPPLTAKQRAMLAALEKMPDEEIDFSDIPKITDFSQFRPAKEAMSVRVDTDVMAWLRSFGKGYQTQVNAILRREMLSKHKTKA